MSGRVGKKGNKKFTSEITTNGKRRQPEKWATSERREREKGDRIGKPALYTIIVKKLNSLKHLVRTNVAESHN